MEVMIGACYHKDPVMMKYLKDKNSDMHADMAKQIFMLDELDRKNSAHNRLRQAAKNGFVFPQFYGDYHANNAASLCEWVKLPQEQWKSGQGIELPDGTPLSDHLRENGIKSFNKFIDHMQEIEDHFWGKRFRVYKDWRDAQVEKYRKKGYLKMLTGFTCSGEMRRNEIVNYPIQGTAFHCLLKTFIKLDEYMREENWDSRLIGQIHDEIVMDTHPEEKEHIKKITYEIVEEYLPAAWDWIILPLEIEVDEYGIDQSWAGDK